ncbi:MAG: sporulation protein YqfD [Oscillospiraceae bacterium]|nr:sporulation protein YqfD [Oscillospiraceae bacterium]
MGLFRNLAGEIRVRLTSADVAEALAAVSGAGIPIKNAAAEDELTFSFTIARGDYKKLSSIAKRRGDLIRLTDRRGIYWDLQRLRRRPVFIFGMVFLLMMAMFVPSRVLLIEVRGNTTIPASQIIEAAGECGICFGASRREVRSEKVKNALLEAMPELAWAGVNTYGCRAVISVRQRDPEPEKMQRPEVAHIVAARDGFVLSCDVVSGSGQCIPGQAVKAGEVLISGYTDCGICITATRADGEIMAATTRALTAVTPAECMKKGRQIKETVKYSLIVGKIRINFDNNSGILDASCGRMVTNYHLTLPGGYRLPVTLVKQTATEMELSAIGTEPTVLQDYAVRYLGSQMIAGTVTEAVESITEDGGVWMLTGDYACTEMIGRERAEQNGELHETD